MRAAALAALVALLAATTPAAQTPNGPDPTKVRLHLGPLLLNPTLSLTNAGVDTNVFDESDASHPKSDFNITLTPQTDLWMRMGRTWLNGGIREDIVWYKRYSSERAGNNGYSLKWLVPLSRVSFTLGGSWLSARERPGFEIDTRVHRRDLNGSVTAELQAFPTTYFGVRVDRTKRSFDERATFLGTDLRAELNRTTTLAGLTARRQLTPLTSLSFEASRLLDRFEFEGQRDSDSNMVSVGLKFDPFALISGSAQVGFRRFTPADPTVPGYKGSTAAVSLAYVLAATSTKATVDVSRDVQYSYDINQPYYLQTGAVLTLSQQIYGPVDVQGRFGDQRLAYRTREGATVDAADRVDHVRIVGGGIGYHLGQDIRLSFNVENQQRRSDVPGRSYDGLRYGAALTFGF